MDGIISALLRGEQRLDRPGLRRLWFHSQYGSESEAVSQADQAALAAYESLLADLERGTLGDEAMLAGVGAAAR